MIKDRSMLERLLQKKEGEVITLIEKPYPDKIKIEDYALQKAFSICNAVKEKSFLSSKEWYGFLVSPDKKRITDIYLEKNEVNEGAYTKISEEAIAKVAERVKSEKKYVVGWIHSHAGMGVFFSQTDAGNIQTVLNSVSLNTRVHSSNEEVLIDNLEVILDNSAEKPKGGLIVKINGEVNKINGIKIFEPVYTGWSYNIVVNDRGEHYEEVAVVQEKPFTKKTKILRNKSELIIIPTLKRVNYAKIQEEVKEKIRTGWLTGSSGLSYYEIYRFLKNVSNCLEGEDESKKVCSELENELKIKIGDRGSVSLISDYRTVQTVREYANSHQDFKEFLENVINTKEITNKQICEMFKKYSTKEPENPKGERDE